jgi:hypothetical protein
MRKMQKKYPFYPAILPARDKTGFLVITIARMAKKIRLS